MLLAEIFFKISMLGIWPYSSLGGGGASIEDNFCRKEVNTRVGTHCDVEINPEDVGGLESRIVFLFKKEK